MDAKKLSLLLAAWVLCSAVGCGLNTAVLQTGGNNCKGVLFNLSCGARPSDPIDPAKPTIVLTHGWNPLPNKIRTTFGPEGARALRCRCGDSYNILSWDWNNVRVPAFHDGPTKVGKCQGRMLAAALRARGVNPRCTQLIAHSLGTVVVAQAAYCMSDLGPFAQITLLDSPTVFHDEVFCHLAVARHARVVENYWAPGLSGFGDQVHYSGVRNYKVEGNTPMLGTFDLSMSNHVAVMLWYYNTMRCPTMSCGFQNSVFVNCCGRGCVCNCPICAGQGATNVPTVAPVPPEDYSPDAIDLPEGEDSTEFEKAID